MASGVTGYQYTPAGANINADNRAQMRIYYTTTRINSTTVRASIDVEIYYANANQGSMNSCAVYTVINGQRQGVQMKPNELGFQRFGNSIYASHPATSVPYTGSPGTWVTGDYEVPYNQTSFNITINFTNRWGYGHTLDQTYNYNSNGAKLYSNTFSIPCEIGYTNIGNPGSPTRNAEWFEGTVGFSWNAASNGTNNNVNGYDWIIQRSSSAGGTSGWSDVTSGSTSYGTRSCSASISSSYRGYNFRCRVRAKGSYNTTGYVDGTSYSCYNYAPSISGTWLYFGNVSNNKVNCGSSVTATGGSDIGGYSGTSTLKYNLSVNGSWKGQKTSTSNSAGCTWTNTLTGLGGLQVPFQIQVSDGFTSVTSGTSPYYIGQNISNNFNTGNVNELTHDTSFTIPRSYIDGYTPASSATETIRLLANLVNDSDVDTWTTIYSGMRTGSALSSSITVDHILGRLYSSGVIDYDDGNSEERSVYFKVYIKINHLETYTNSYEKKFRNWVITNKLNYPDESETYKFSFATNIPVTNESFRISWDISSYPSGELTSGRLRRIVYYRQQGTENSWIQLEQVTYSGESTSSYNTYYLSNFLTRGDQIELKILWQWQNNGIWYNVREQTQVEWDSELIPVNNVGEWLKSNKYTVLYKWLPDFYSYINNITDSGMLNNNTPGNNRIAWKSVATANDNSAILILTNALAEFLISGSSTSIDSVSIDLQTIVDTADYAQFSNWYELNNNIDSNLQYHRLAYSLFNEDSPEVQNGGENTNAIYSINTQYIVNQTLTFCELYRFSPTATKDETLALPDYPTGPSVTGSFPSIAFDTIASPYFVTDSTIDWERSDYSTTQRR